MDPPTRPLKAVVASITALALAVGLGCDSDEAGSQRPAPAQSATMGPSSELADSKRPDGGAYFNKPAAPLIASLSSPALTPGTIDVEKFEIVGQVKQRAPQLGAPVENATIYVDTSTRGAHTVHSDDKGVFRVSVVYGEFQRIRIEAPEFVGAERSRDTLIGWLSKSSQRRTNKQIIYLHPGIAVEGTVVAAGEPIKDVSVRCVSKGMNGTPALASSGLTDAKGAFRIACPRERVKLLGVHRGYQHGVTEWIDLKQSPDTKPQISLKRGAHLLGRVLAEDGHPLSQATLTISVRPAPRTMHTWKEWRLHLEPGPFWRLSESDGSFDYGPVSGPLLISAEANGLKGSIALDVDGLDERYVEITVR
jgi:uncharacterized GH25 family protein